jgi:hypothetical protein
MQTPFLVAAEQMQLDRVLITTNDQRGLETRKEERRRTEAVALLRFRLLTISEGIGC